MSGGIGGGGGRVADGVGGGGGRASGGVGGRGGPGSDGNGAGGRRPSGGAHPARGDAGASLSTDREIAALISATVHEPFRELWRRYEREAWAPVLAVLDEVVAAHEGAMGGLGGDGVEGTGGAEGAGSATGAQASERTGAVESAGTPGDVETSEGAEGRVAGEDAGAGARYRRRVVDDVLGPLRSAVRDARQAVTLEAALAETARQVAGGVDALPAMATVPLSPSALEPQPGIGLWPAVKRGVARTLRPLLWRREAHDVAVAEVARGHLGRVVLPGQLRAFRESQRSRAAWLGGLERAWAEWVPEVLGAADLDAAKRLDRELRALAAGDSSPWGRGVGMDEERSEGILLATVAVAGTFAEIDADGDTAPRRDEEAAAEWDRWADESAARLDLCAILLDACDAVDGTRREMIASWAGVVGEIDAALSEVGARLDGGRARAERLAGKVAGLAEALQREEERTVDDISRIEGTLPDPGRLLDALTGAVDEALARFEETGEQMPEALVVHRVPRADAGMRRPGGPGHAVELREAALQAFDALRSQRIRRAPTAISEAMGRVHTVVAELREVSAYGYEAAIAELSEAADPAEVESTVMVVNGLSRAARKVEDARAILFDALAATEASANLEIAEGIEHLVQRATADRLTARYLDARSHVVAEAARDQKKWRRRLARVAGRATAAWRILRTRLWPVKRVLGIGADLRSQAELRDRSLAFAEEVPARLPVVYRRLFAFEPLSDPRLLAGREDAVDAVESSWARWQSERTRSLMVVAPPGSGITSFLNIVAGRLRAEAPQVWSEAPPVVRQTLRERMRTEADLASRLGGWLGLGHTPGLGDTQGLGVTPETGDPPDPGDAPNLGDVADPGDAVDLGNAPDLEALASRILRAPPDTLPHVVILEGAEHLHLRVPNGARLLERMLAFSSRTQPRVFWVLSMTSSAWQLAKKRSPASFGDLESIELDSLTATELEQAVLARHRLSGLPLQYVEPRTGRHLLLGRARGIGSRKHEQQIEADYFQKLHRASLGSIRLALFHWLRSADFRTVEGSLLVQPLEPLQPFAGALDIDQSFALKALLDHGTLTVREYCEIVRVPLPQGRHLFHALCDLRVVEPAPGAADPIEASPDSDAQETLYRVQPLLAGAVVAHLKSLNILH